MKIQVIIGTTRPNRFSEKPAGWIMEQLKKRKDIETELVDLRDYPLPFFNEISSPVMIKGKYSTNVATKWAKKVSEADGYIIITGEYNHGYPAVLKNALDYVYEEWNQKAVGFVGYGGVGGARAIEQLREVAVELQMSPIRTAIHIPWQMYIAAVGGKNAKEVNAAFESLDQQAEGFIDQLIWWTKALKKARSAKSA